MTKNKIVEVLMERDGFTRAEAENEFAFVQSEFMAALSGQSGLDPEEVLYEYLGLEPDYIFDLLPI